MYFRNTITGSILSRTLLCDRLSTSMTKSQKMLDICIELDRCLDIVFSAEKSTSSAIGKVCDSGSEDLHV